LPATLVDVVRKTAGELANAQSAGRDHLDPG
jgi:hypothetical protein